MSSPARHARPVDLAGRARIWRILLPYKGPLLTLNDKRHWARSWPDVLNLQHSGYFLAKHHGVPLMSCMTVELIFWPGTNRVHDADNLAPMLKALMDGVKKAGVVPDDRGRHVRSATCTVIERDDDPERRTDPRMVLVIREIEGITHGVDQAATSP
jgi:crossover junction endodeoxyribonuclease RusA